MQQVRNLCLYCDSVVPDRTIKKCGTKPGFCREECRRSYRKAYLAKWTQDNKQLVSKRRDENRDQVRAWSREFYARNRERRKALRRQIYQKDPAKALGAAKKYAQAHPDLIRSLGRKSAFSRRARLVELFVEVVDPLTVFERDKGICGICNGSVDRKERWEVDHKVPLARGGKHCYANVQLAHRKCNRSKGARCL